ncbi:MAG TPA: hypothetical protein VHB99_01560 [Pirellulales bacterium]|nr:hypothetical protein [Pirellulales bacterium]
MTAAEAAGALLFGGLAATGGERTREKDSVFNRLAIIEGRAGDRRKAAARGNAAAAANGNRSHVLQTSGRIDMAPDNLTSAHLKLAPRNRGAARIASASLLFNHFFDGLNEMRRFVRSGQLRCLLVGLLAFAVLEASHLLERLVKNAPKGFQPNFFGGFGTALALGRLFNFRRLGGSAGFFGGFAFSSQFLAVNNLTSHVVLSVEA